MRFYVQSATGKGSYFVDLSEDGGHGFCDCPNFSCRIAPKRKEGKRGYCKHLKAAFGYFGWQMAQQIAQQAKKHARHNPI